MSSKSLLLMLPRELRDEIYLLLALNQHVFTSSPKPRDRSLRRRHAVSEAHIDTRIYVPVLAPTNLLGACRQLREECLDIISRIVNSPSHTSSNYPQLAGEVESNGLATRENSQLEEISERAKDDGSVRITLELALPIRTNMGAYIPKRDSPSPCFMALLPLLSRARKIKFVVWGAYDWWKGPQQRYVRVERSERSLVKRTSSDQTDEVLSARKNASSVIPVPASSKPNPLSIAIDAIMKHLPLVEEVKVDVLMHAGDYWNWDLPDNRWEGIQGWLDGTIYSHEGKKLKKVYRRLIACDPTPPARGVTFYHQLETCEDMEEGSRNSVVHIAEGSREVPEDFEDAQEEPPFTKAYDRTE
ncbi:hypothetical protein K505DRAFT_347440 [Melanomma pulvis-pyrius CBS 109.77]|uniref:F-box domain-containing protein n=1 Tax=Melanomma pulvis-pyrius CBS 109.77 TaxID=1314802 RepID=A0A6A6XLS5_9PLEO|nr:hypothetical protein K505DRAFT_347440 [Melanomma pulvis-pyrius CBS 109.77]